MTPPENAARQQECPEGGNHVLMSDGDGYSCRYCRTPMTLGSAALPHRCRLCGANPPLGGSDPDYTPRPHDTASEPEMWSQCADEDACRARWVAWQRSWDEAIFNG